MRIFYLADVADQSIHGLRWANYFAKNGHEVHIISLGKPNNDIKDIALHIIKTRDTKIRAVRWIVNSLPILLQTKRLLKVIKPDILHAHCAYDYGVIGSLSNFHPFVVTAWGSDILISSKESNITKYTEKFALKRADLIICDGENLKDAIINLGITPEKIKLIYYGADTKKFSPKQRDKELREELKALDTPMVISNRRLKPIYNVESLIKAIPSVLKDFPDTKIVIVGTGLRENYSINADEKIILFLSRIHERKGADTLIEAFNKLKSEFENVKRVIAGPDEGYLDKLKLIVSKLNIEGDVIFHGPLYEKDKLEAYVDADVFVLPSKDRYESFGNVVLEAMACGTPVIVTNNCEVSEWIGDDVGYVVEYNKDQLKDAIFKILSDDKLRIKFGGRGRRLLREKFGLDKMVKSIEELYGSCL